MIKGEVRDIEAIRAMLPKMTLAAATDEGCELSPQQTALVLEFFSRIKPTEGVDAEIDLRAGSVTLSIGSVFEVSLSEDEDGLGISVHCGESGATLLETTVYRE